MVARYQSGVLVIKSGLLFSEAGKELGLCGGFKGGGEFVHSGFWFSGFRFLFSGFLFEVLAAALPTRLAARWPVLLSYVRNIDGLFLTVNGKMKIKNVLRTYYIGMSFSAISVYG
jgi:hypothetical protein